MECLCYYYLNYENRNIRIFWGPEPTILTDGIRKSPLIHLNKKFSKKIFFEKFLSDESDTHYRKVYRLSDKEGDPFYQFPSVRFLPVLSALRFYKKRHGIPVLFRECAMLLRKRKKGKTYA